MKQTFPPEQVLNSMCYHCGTRHGIHYYKESNGIEDMYYCEGCHGLYEWDGEHMMAANGEAYPNRDKSNDLALKIK